MQGCDSTWVIQDFTASDRSELTVSRGQQVELSPEQVPPTASTDMVLVRLSLATGGPDGAGCTKEGLVPVSCLKLPPGGIAALRSHAARHDGEGGKKNSAD